MLRGGLEAEQGLQARRATRADGEVKAPARVVDSPAAFNSRVGAVLAALPG
ncbi:hypothetical protein L483_10575 [Pseudomonas putida H8234]|nr:hypothetical protein L483_10575 [Pseudomonas putida H8234]